MSSANVPEPLKGIISYLQRADELTTRDAVMAYYCYAHVENFALGIFTRADDEDRAGKASKKTAKSFLAASTFVEVLKGFGPIDDGVAEKIKYSRFKAIDIIKAI